MLIYNVTVKVENAIAEDWLHWLKETHIPEILSTGCFTEASVLHLMEPLDEAEEGITYAVQYKTNSRDDYEKYLHNHAAEMRRRGIEKWGDRFIAFRSLMKVIH
jgi:hypothetical protein